MDSSVKEEDDVTSTLLLLREEIRSLREQNEKQFEAILLEVREIKYSHVAKSSGTGSEECWPLPTIELSKSFMTHNVC